MFNVKNYLRVFFYTLLKVISAFYSMLLSVGKTGILLTCRHVFG